MLLKPFFPLGKKTAPTGEWGSSRQANLTLKAWLKKIYRMPVAHYSCSTIRSSAHPCFLIFHTTKSSFETGLMTYKTTVAPFKNTHYLLTVVVTSLIHYSTANSAFTCFIALTYEL